MTYEDTQINTQQREKERKRGHENNPSLSSFHVSQSKTASLKESSLSDSSFI